MAVAGWLIDKSALTRLGDPEITRVLSELGRLRVCPVAELEQLYSARSADDYEDIKERIPQEFVTVDAPTDVLQRALRLQRDLAHHHGLWHRMPIPDLLIAETALYHGLGVVTADADFERITEVRPLEVRRLG